MSPPPDAKAAREPRAFPSPFQASLLVLSGVFVASLVAALVQEATSPATAAGLATVFGLGAAALLGASHVPPPHAERLGLRRLRPAQLVALVLLLPVVLLAAELDPLLSTWLPAPDAAAYEQRLREALPTGEKLGLVETVVVVMGLAPLVEEWLFRGVIQQGLVAHLGATGGIFVTALLFALGHGGAGLSVQAWAAVVAQVFVLGLAFGWVRHATGSLFAAILLHAGTNGLGVLALTLGQSQAAAAGGHLPLGVLAGAALSVALGGWWLRRIPPVPAAPEPSSRGADDVDL